MRPDPGLIEVADSHRVRYDYGSSAGTHRPSPRVYTRTGIFQQVIDPSPTRGHDAGNSSDELEKASDNSANESQAGPTFHEEALIKEREADREAKKKKAQWRKWSEDIIPALIEPYVSLLREMDSLRNMDNI